MRSPRPRLGRLLAALLAVTILTVSGCSTRGTADAPTEPTAKGQPGGAAGETVAVQNVESCATVSAARPAEPAPGQRLPDIDLPCLTSGPAVNLAALHGRPTVINLWASWCGACRDEMPLLQAAHSRYGDRVAFLGVDTKDNPAGAGSLLRETGVSYPQVVDTDGQLLEYLHIPGLPVTVVLDAEGRISGRQVGAVTEDDLTNLIEDALL